MKKYSLYRRWTGGAYYAIGPADWSMEEFAQCMLYTQPDGLSIMKQSRIWWNEVQEAPEELMEFYRWLN